MRARQLRREDGFTLPEMLITIMVMIVVLFALYNIFDTSIRIFRFGNDKVEAVDNARLGMEKMAREVRAAYAVDRANKKRQLFWNPAYPSTSAGAAMPTGNRITFGNDLNGSRKIEPAEEITYKLSTTGPPHTLQRLNGGSESPVIEFVRTGGLTFSYLRKNGTVLSASELSNPANEPQIAIVRMQLTIEVNSRTQTLTSDVTLRNRG